MKRSEIKEKAWNDAVISMESKKISEWVDTLREGCGSDIRIISCDNFGLPTTIISDTGCGDAYIVTVDHSASEIEKAVECSFLSEEVTKIISELYLSANK